MFFHSCPEGVEDPRNENINPLTGVMYSEGKGREEITE